MYHFEALPGKEKIDDPGFKARIDAIVRDARTVLSVGWRQDAGYDLFNWLMAHGKEAILVEAWAGNFDGFNCPGVVKIHGDIEAVEPLLSVKALGVVLWQDGPEHMEMDRAQALIRKLQQRAGAIILATPNGEQGQDALDGNEWERHRSAWYIETYQELSFTAQVYESGLIGFWRK